MMQNQLYTTEEAADYLGLSPRFLEARRYRGGGPPYVKISARCVRYRAEDLQEWISEHVRTSTADTGEEDELPRAS